MNLSVRVVLFLAFFVTCGSTFSDDHTKIRDELIFLNNNIKIGSTDSLLSKAALIQYGYGECKFFAMLLKDNLAEKGFASRLVGMVSKAGGGHEFLEIRVGHKWLLSDPLNGILYANSFFDIIINPSLADAKLFQIAQSRIPQLTTKEFFRQAAGIYLGDFYYSDNYRFIGLPGRNAEGNEDSQFLCSKKSCQWEIVLPKKILNDKLFQSLPLVIFDSLDQNLKFDIKAIRLNASSFVPWIIKPDGSVLKFETTSNGPHSFSISLLSSPIKNSKNLKMRAPIPEVLVFRDFNVDFYGAKAVCDNNLVWDRDVSEGSGDFYNAYFEPVSKNVISAWSPVSVVNNLKYRQTVLGLSNNEPRIRFQPLIVEKNAHCELTIRYKTDKTASVSLFFQKDDSLILLGKLKPCKKEVCRFIHRFNQSEMNSIFTS